MNTTYILLTTIIRTRTHIDRTPFEQFISYLPFLVLIIGVFVFGIFYSQINIK